MFVDLKGEWWNVDQIAKIEPFHPAKFTGWGDAIPNQPATADTITYVATLSTGQARGITDEEFKRIMNVSNAGGRL
jgi:hypothetical protein